MGITGPHARPHVLLLIDWQNWAFGTLARAIKQHLNDRFAFTIAAVKDQVPIDDTQFDILHVFSEAETYHHQFLTGHAKILKSVYSHKWEKERGLTAREFYHRHLREAHAITVPSTKLLHSLAGIPPPVYLIPEGVDTALFTPAFCRSGPLRVGWAGNPHQDIKRLPWLQQACEGLCELSLATGDLSPEGMVNFYNTIDVIACCSEAEGSPRPLIEGMACGAFPVSFDIGIARELIDPGVNGLLVGEESVRAFRKALQWCNSHTAYIRSTAGKNAELMRATRSWQSTLPHLADVYYSLL
ncbi:MAG TPA: glycosyltransferase family 4 protein [Candidatus Peribacteraceae bacterium]|nr:glycosyltransferase family 4 protein [Candidatus Peribacteraceae bacterium]